MKTAGVRDLKTHLSGYLRDVARGDVVLVTDRGRVVAEQLQRARPGLRVLYMSGYTDDAIVHHGVLDFGTKFLGKPFSPADLARKVRDVLDANRPNPDPVSRTL